MRYLTAIGTFLLAAYSIYLNTIISDLEFERDNLEERIAALSSNIKASDNVKPHLEEVAISRPKPNGKFADENSTNQYTEIKTPKESDERTITPSKDKGFNEQSVDETWAFEFSDQIHYFFMENEILNKLRVTNIDCRETACRVDIYINKDEPIETATAIGKIFGSDEHWQAHPFYFNSTPEDGVIRVEINRYK
ncbi:hypothetical protein [Pseudoalteromonas sp. S2755]|uniref:hypothetical protein n=1 Tax=Pseudoalteromonas sp. S2755 TaxID=2066523 RepID=UPI00110A2C72|nr:hypothetical protein [Pseudoalteromonas sp. S2755]TMN41088.1 hypothetical protein CWC03_08060 [Pseudoalteromonas sp. S2755]